MSKKASNSNFLNIIKQSIKSLIFPLFAIIISIFVAVFFVMWSKGYAITQYFSALTDLFSIIWEGSFATKRNALTTISYVTPLIFTGIANAVAFKCGLFNIGVEGQFIMGMISAAIIGLIPGLNPFIHIILIILGGMLAGTIWGGIPGILKAKFGTNEVINTIMMNYIGMYFANWIVQKSVFSVAPTYTNTPLIQQSARLMPLSKLSKANIGIFIAIAFAILVYWLLWKTTIGYEIRGVGINPSGAEYGGINVAKNMTLAMVISGALAGVGGATHLSGVLYQCQDFMAFPGFGFDGIAVALLAKSNPIGCIASAILFGALNSSATMLQFNDIPKEIVFLIQSIIIIFVATDYVVKYFADKKKKGEIING
ncbi:ABC transporter permease [Clostridium brassicae]|uniref:ABC transporter permease n=1 Tax=Clostridium brassicae TaxID=2999072 RepID=A0ABT4DD76_9CLOT|nr:ABC transporter permease [Clostridium brassicae]MCY6958969.1 ABC transporter permease [Clostridium brassicae]